MKNYYNTLEAKELVKMLAETKLDYQRANRNCWYDKIIRRETKFITIRDILDNRGIELTDTERKYL